MKLYAYQNAFFSYQQAGSLSSARVVIPHLLEHLKVKSVLDVGCGAGAWVTAYLESGLTDVIGVDGEYVHEDQLLFSRSKFIAIDITHPFFLKRQFDLVQCLEVAEHIDPSASETLINNLVKHASIVLFSAAPPGQGGEHHINEQPYQYWRHLFEKHDFLPFDFLRPRIREHVDVESWYRYNTMIFVRRDVVQDLPQMVSQSLVNPNVRILDIAPVAYRMRRKLLSLLPSSVITYMALLKHWAILLSRSMRSAR